MPTLSWLTRDEDLKTAGRAPYRLLQEVPELGHGDPDTGNMLIQGDNLEALKSLLPFYAGQVKCIYIDPPYNTGSAFEHYDDNLEHSLWLAMMWPRLELLRELLADDGLLFCQIDDNEGPYLTVILDEIFGRGRRMNVISVKMSEATGVKMAHVDKRLPKMKETILVYRRGEAPTIKPIAVPNGEWNPEYKEIVSDLSAENIAALKEILELDSASDVELSRARALVRGGRIVSLAKYFEEFGIKKSDQDAFRWENAYRIVQAVGAASILKSAAVDRTDGEDISATRSSRGKLSIYKSNFDQSTKDPRIRLIFSDKYLTTNPGDFWSDIKTTGGVGQEGGVDFPKGKKPEQLIHRILDLHTVPGDLVLDSFLGSGTTAAVAQKMGRRYIGIEVGDHAVTHCQPRLTGVVDGEQGGVSKAQNWTGGGGFRFWRLGPPVFDDTGRISGGIAFSTLAAHVWFSETSTPLDPKTKGPLLGVRGDRAVALLYNGVLGDKRPAGGNVLTRQTLAIIREGLADDFDGDLIVYGERSALTPATLARERIEFKQTPYDVKARR